MFISYIKAILAFAASFNLVTAGLPPLNSNIEIYNARGDSSADTLKQIRRSLSSAIVHQRKTDIVFKNSTSLDKSWDGAVLFLVEGIVPPGSHNTTLYGGIEIICTTCYIKGIATAQLNVDGDYSQAFDNITSKILDESEDFFSEIPNYVQNVSSNVDLFDPDKFDFPPIDINFDIDVPKIPETELQFQLDGMELYMQVDTVLAAGATYTLNIYTSKTPLGLGSGDSLFVGVVITIDLILDVVGDIDISSGFHIQLNDGIKINIPIFGQNVSEITYNGGQFEFLPVTVKSAGIVLTGILRIGLKAGFGVSTAAIKALNEVVEFGVGVQSGVWLDVARFSTNITSAPATNGNECQLRVIENYSMALGAKAGAYLQIGHDTWDAEIDAEIPIFYTTLVDACAIKKTSTIQPIPTASIEARQDIDTTTTKVTYTMTQCISTGLINCPASLRTISKNIVTKTLTAIVTPGVEPQFIIDNTVADSIRTTIAFGTNARKMEATSGSPVSYVPKPTSKNDLEGGSGILGDNFFNKETGGVSNKLVVGLGIGLGVPVLLLVIAGFLFCRRKRASTARGTTPMYQSVPALQGNPWTGSKKSANVVVTELQHLT